MPAVTRLRLRDFRSYRRVEIELKPGTTVVHGRNGAGKTNLLEAVYMGCTARSWRTSTEREVVGFGASAARVEMDTLAADGAHVIEIGLMPGQPKSIRIDGSAVERFSEHPARPLASVFSPDRLELVKGPPAVRRAHLDALVTGLWPARAATRRAYAQALAQRNALLARVRHGASSSALDAWDLELAVHGVALRDDRSAAAELIAERFEQVAAELGLEGGAESAYRPRSRAATAEELAAELRERRGSDLERGFTQHGPHRDDLVLSRGGRELRAYGSQGEQRIALLALLLAEREALAAERAGPPVMLLDDVMSELDGERRGLLMARLAGTGQALITSTELEHVPASGAEIQEISVAPGSAVCDSGAVAA